MEITSVRLRKIYKNGLFAIASITCDNQMIINDIKMVAYKGKVKLIFPNSEFAERNNQHSIVTDSEFYEKALDAVIKEFKKNEPVMQVDIFRYRFYTDLTEEEKEQRVLVKLSVGVSGVKLSDEKYRVSLQNIKIVANREKLKTFDDYKDITVVYDENGDISEVDEEQLPRLTRNVKAVYEWRYLADNGIRKKYNLPTSAIYDIF